MLIITVSGFGKHLHLMTLTKSQAFDDAIVVCNTTKGLTWATEKITLGQVIVPKWCFPWIWDFISNYILYKLAENLLFQWKQIHKGQRRFQGSPNASRKKEPKMIWHRLQLSTKASFLLPWWRFMRLYRCKPHLPLSGTAKSNSANDRTLAFEALHCSATHRNNLRSQRFVVENGTLPTLITACQPVDNLLVLYFIWYFHIYNPLQYSAVSI